MALTSLITTGQTAVSKVWVADNGDGSYKNPILHADYSDADVVRVGDDFYLTASSFNSVPGLPILHSRDLVTGPSWATYSPGSLLSTFTANRSTATESGHRQFDTTTISSIFSIQTRTTGSTW